DRHVPDVQILLSDNERQSLGKNRQYSVAMGIFRRNRSHRLLCVQSRSDRADAGAGGGGGAIWRSGELHRARRHADRHPAQLWQSLSKQATTKNPRGPIGQTGGDRSDRRAIGIRGRSLLRGTNPVPEWRRRTEMKESDDEWKKSAVARVRRR